MRPVAELDRAEARGLEGLLFDLDDTVLDRGALGERAYASLFALSRAGLRLVAVTGRPSGWGEVIARMWPVDGVVTENGAVALHREGEAVRRWEAGLDEATRRERRIRLASMIASMRERFGEVRLSDDTEARRSDVAIDVGETQRVPPERVAEMETFARSLGARTFVSTVHLHLTLDAHDKATGALAYLRDRFGVDRTAARARYAFAGDSGNDAACFAGFRTTFGVANVRAHLRVLSVPPRWVATAERGAGFAEIAAALLAARSVAAR